MDKKPIVLFFSRDYQADFFPTLISDKYESIHVTLNSKEKRKVERKGGKVVGCLEELYGKTPSVNVEFPYLDHSLGSDRFLVGHSHQNRLDILRKCVSFWTFIYETYKPNFIVNEVVALEISEIMYIEARKRGIRYLAFGAFPVKTSFYWHESPFHSSMPLRIENIVPNQIHLNDAQEYIDKITTGPIDNPFVKEFKLGKDVKRLISSIKLVIKMILYRITIKSLVIRQLCYGYAPSYFIDEIRHYVNYILKQNKYDSLSDVKDTDKCIFYPMHFEPEATLFYMSTYYENQLAFIENVLKCLPEDEFLLIKEHPAQAGYLMQKQWGKLKRRFPNVKFIKADVSSKEIILRTDITLTLVSTAGFEALILGKPVIALGKIYFDSYEGVNFCKTFEEMYDLLRGNTEIKKGGDIKTYLAKLIAIQNIGNPWPSSILYTEENIKNIRSAIESNFVS